jgi:tetratricopeptide (TPR) repeat protein
VAAACSCLLLPTAIARPAIYFPPEPLRAVAGIDGGRAYLWAIPLIALVADAVVVTGRRAPGLVWPSVLTFGSGIIAVVVLGVSTTIHVLAYRSTEGLLRRDVAAAPSSADARARLAEYYLGRGESEPAIVLLTGLSLERNESTAAALADGDVRRAIGQPDEAADWYRAAERLDPAGEEGPSRLAALYLNSGRPGDAIDCYTDAIRRHPRSTALRNDLGAALLAQRNFPAAAAQLRAVLDIDPDMVEAHVNLATALLGQGELAEAGRELVRAVELDPTNADAFRNAGIVMYQLHDYASAARMLTAATRLRPTWVQARNELGVALLAAGDPEAAAAEFERSITLDPSDETAKRGLQRIARRSTRP